MSGWEQLTLWPEEPPKPITCDFCQSPLVFYYDPFNPPIESVALGVIVDYKLKCMSCLKNENISSEVEK